MNKSTVISTANEDTAVLINLHMGTVSSILTGGPVPASLVALTMNSNSTH